MDKFIDKFWLDWSRWDVPEHTQEAFENYILRGYPPGSFMMAVLCNDFVGAVHKADHINKGALVDIAKWMLNVPPSECWGNSRAVKEWLEDKDKIRSTFYERVEKQRMWEALQT